MATFSPVDLTIANKTFPKAHLQSMKKPFCEKSERYFLSMMCAPWGQMLVNSRIHKQPFCSPRMPKCISCHNWKGGNYYLATILATLSLSSQKH